MSPCEHGETYVLQDGGECDLDLGNYERFLDINLTKFHNITTGKIYQSVINKERKGAFLGKTVQVIPHITDEIELWIDYASKIPINGCHPHFCIIELGGTIGDIETMPFIEAIRRMSLNDTHKFCFIHVSLIIDNGELKTKPTQHSISTLRSLGINPEFLILRSKTYLNADLMKKLSIQCHINQHNIIINTEVPNIYYVPNVFFQQNLTTKIFNFFNYNTHTLTYNLSNYFNIINHISANKPVINITIAGKYVGSNDTYLSLIRALEHAAFYLGYHIKIIWINTDEIGRAHV
jgi:CTP synthase